MDQTIEVQLISDRLILRNLRPEDVTQAYADWLNDPGVNRYLHNSNSRNTIHTCREYVRSYDGSLDKALIGVFEKPSELHIGNLTFSSVAWETGSATVGVCLGRSGYGGKGYATEAMISISEFCFDHLELHRIEAQVSVHNTSSVNLFIRSGFRVEGMRREAGLVGASRHSLYVMGLLSTDKIGGDAPNASPAHRGLEQ